MSLTNGEIKLESLIVKLQDSVENYTSRIDIMESAIVGQLTRIAANTESMANTIRSMQTDSTEIVRLASGKFQVHGGLVIALIVLFAVLNSWSRHDFKITPTSIEVRSGRDGASPEAVKH